MATNQTKAKAVWSATGSQLCCCFTHSVCIVE